MSGLTNAFQRAILDGLAGGYVGLFTTAPSDDQPGAEAPVARVPHSFGSAYAVGGKSRTQNVSTVTFAAPTVDVGTVTHFALFAESSGGSWLACGALSAPLFVNAGDVPSFPAGALYLELT